MASPRPLRIAIIGAGPGGICMAIRLREVGFDDIVLFERSGGIGGTWNRNRYPGCACDIQSELYSFSFAPNLEWTRPYATQPEILAYLERVVDDHGIRPLIRFDHAVAGATWDDTANEWTVRFESGGTHTADVLISALGMFNDLNWPDIDGFDSFAGTSFHSAQWNWDHDLSGERVAVIGSAASAVQFIPQLAPVAGELTVYQRTANWVLPKEDEPYTPEQLEARRRDPSIVAARRQELWDRVETGMAFTDATARAELEKIGLAALEVVEDPETRAKLRPTHPWGCKRPLFANDYFPTFNRPNVELVTDPIARITPGGVVTADGTERPADTLVVATGFAANRYLSCIDVVGRGGVSIADAWSDGAQAYYGVTTAGFPNLFMLYGPNTNQGSIITMIEFQVDHALGLIRRIADEQLAWLDVRPEPMAEFNDAVQEGIEGVEVWHSGCNGYYRSPSGRVVTQWPHKMGDFRRELAEIDPSVYAVAPAG